MSERRLRVSKITQRSGDWRRDKEVASIRLSGQWLDKAGFGIGQQFIVRESPGRLELIADWVDQCGVLQDQDHGTAS